MIVTLEVPDEQVEALKAQAEAQGLTLEDWIQTLARQSQAGKPNQPLKSAYGLLAKYGPAPSAEEIDANRADMFRGFAEDF
jgi:hypothetical protein